MTGNVCRGRIEAERARGIPERLPASDPIVRLLQPARGIPTTSVEERAVAILKLEGEIPFERLLQRLASERYLEELRRGAGILDIGLFGPKLFLSNVASELKAGDNILWQIEGSKE